MNRRSFFSFLAVAPVAGLLPVSKPPKKSFREAMRIVIDKIIPITEWHPHAEKYKWIKPHIPFDLRKYRVDFDL